MGVITYKDKGFNINYFIQCSRE